ncbi:hypothetical protein M9434_005240 [Picochlorum sp. BPE23]|nr:hypothetical protein M9434_005240 [Picochlorum sp. BPE23]
MLTDSLPRQRRSTKQGSESSCHYTGYISQHCAIFVDKNTSINSKTFLALLHRLKDNDGFFNFRTCDGNGTMPSPTPPGGWGHERHCAPAHAIARRSSRSDF